MIESNCLQASDSIYEMRMNEFCVNRLGTIPLVSTTVDEELTRPKCSISPIDQSNIVATDYSMLNNENYLQNSTNNLSIYSPYMNKIRPDTLQTKALVQSHATACSLYDSALQDASLFSTSSPYNLPPKKQTDTQFQSNILSKNIFLKNPDESKQLHGASSLHDSALQENVNGSGLFATSSPYYFSAKQQANTKFESTNLSKNIFLRNQSVSNLKPAQLQSTPNKASNSLLMPVPTIKVNFHSILDLAKSDDSAPSTSINEANNTISTNSLSDNNNNNNNSSGFASIISINSSNSSSCINSFNTSSLNLKVKEYSSLLSMSYNNKENSQTDFLSKNKRKPRTQINRQQREILEYAYNLKGYPDSNEIEYLCNILGFEENVIRIWFQNKRARDKQRH